MGGNKRKERVKLRDGVSLQYTLHGNPASTLPRLALVHTLGLGEFVWDGVIERLTNHTPEGAVILTYDCRGHGQSDTPEGPYSLEAFGHDLEDLLNRVGWASSQTKVHVAGASMGGCVAQQMALTRPDVVQSLALFDTTAWFGAGAPEAWEGRAKQAEEKGMASLVDFQHARWFSDEYQAQQPEVVARTLAALSNANVKGFAATCRMLGTIDLRSQLAQLRIPTAVIVGEQDMATPLEMSRDLQSRIAGATLEIIPRARHLSFIERADAAAAALSKLIARG
jgi:3-oxoadipate enol-lactonase